MNSSQKILVIGYGSIGKRHVKNCRSLLPNSKIAVYRQHNKANDQIIDGVDLVTDSLEQALEFAPNLAIISSPANTHINNACTFLNYGSNLFIEKPLAEQFETVRPLLDLHDSSNSFVMVGYVLRFLPILKRIHNLILNKEIGQVLTSRIKVGQYLPDWRPNSDYRKGVSAQKLLGGGALLELSHELDYASWLFGFPDSLLCSATKVSQLEIDVEDCAYTILEYNQTNELKRVLVQLDFLERTPKMSIEIVATEATLQADLIKETLTIEPATGQKYELTDFKRSASGNEIYLRQFDYLFKNCFPGYQTQYTETENFSDSVNLCQAARVLKLVDLAKVSNSLGQRINIPKEI